MSRVTRWWWIRHAPSRAPAGRLNGRGDVPADLSDAGALAALAASLPARALWLASPLRRAAETADALLAAAAAPPAAPILEPDLMEQDFGDWEGRAYGDIDADFWRHPAGHRPPGGESFAEVAARVAGAIGRWSDEAKGGDIVAVAHAGVVRAALARALGATPAAALRFAVEPLSLTRLERIARKGGGGEAWRVVCANRPPGAAQNPNS